MLPTFWPGSKPDNGPSKDRDKRDVNSAATAVPSVNRDNARSTVTVHNGVGRSVVWSVGRLFGCPLKRDMRPHD